MASFKNKKNLLQQRGEYARYFDNLRGVDFSSDQNDVEDSRFAYLVNMYRDYQSGQGGAVETIPGFRKIHNFDGRINGIHIGNGRIFVHSGRGLFEVGDVMDVKNPIIYKNHREISNYSMFNTKTTSFVYQDKLYIIGGGNFKQINYDEEGESIATDVSDVAYLPTTWSGIDPEAATDTNPDDYGKGREFEQRNLLNEKYKSTYIADGKEKLFYLKGKTNLRWRAENDAVVTTSPRETSFLEGFDVYQYGVRLPLAIKMSADGEPRVPQGFPNAIYGVYPGDGKENMACFKLVNAPPRPEKNTWNPEKWDFDWSDEDIINKVPEQDGYSWPYAFASKYPGIELIASDPIVNISGVTEPHNIQSRIISDCNIATVYANHIFLSGNPNFPRHIFYNAIKNDGTGVPDATYFGQLNYEIEGNSSSRVVAMMNIGESLLVLKEDGDEEDSVIVHTSQTGPSDVKPIIFPSEKGHRGIGCLGPCFNFRDDPVFLSRFGVDALGHVSTKYRRAIKHRSSMIDAKLLNCDLANASITEWDGYLMILTAGRIFMADSRQMYNTPNGNTEYEWYYLEDIGVYNGQFDEYVYAEFPTDLTEEQRLERTGGVKIVEAKRVINDNGVAESLIGSPANADNEEIKWVETEYGITYYRELPEYDEYTNPTGKTIKYYVFPSGAKTGGEFDPAVLIKTIGSDLFFATEKGVLCKFNFDMRDPDTGLIPYEYYDFCGRAIFSGCATKMDNCGIPHLTKTTVKRSTVIKTRTFEASGVKVKVRTNRKAFNQVARIVNGRATFEDPSFGDYSFTTGDKSIFSINEREKKWVEKQIFLYSDEFHRPFAIHYMAYRYVIAGRYKE